MVTTFEFIASLRPLMHTVEGCQQALDLLTDRVYQEPHNFEIYVHLTTVYFRLGMVQDAVKLNTFLMQQQQDSLSSVLACSMAISSLLEAGMHRHARDLLPVLEERLVKCLQDPPLLDNVLKARLHNVAMSLPYLRDDPEQNRMIMQAIGAVISG